MKCSIFSAALILAASTASALYVPPKEAPRDVSSGSDLTPDEVIDAPISKAEFTRLYEIVEELIENEDYVGLSALHFLTGNALEDFESNGEKAQPSTDAAPEVVTKRGNIRNVNQQFSGFSRFFSGRP